MSKPTTKPTDSKHYIIVTFYKRREQVRKTKEAAIRAIQAHALVSTAPHYTELWEMSNETDGVMLQVLENSARVLNS